MSDQELISKLDKLYLRFLEQAVSVEGPPDWDFDVLREARDRLKELTKEANG
jgi:hypothetical protein